MEWKLNKDEKPEEYRTVLVIDKDGHLNLGLFVNVPDHPYYRIRGDWDDLFCKDEFIVWWQYVELPQ